MTTTTETDPAAVGIALPVDSYEDYADRAAATNSAYTTSVDALDVASGWTAQSEGPIPQPEQLPGQLYHPSQLPDPRIAQATGFPAQAIPEYLVTTDADHPNGPELDEAAEERRTAIRDNRIETAVQKPGGPETPAAKPFLGGGQTEVTEPPPAQ
jgi:hypothetical protein